MKRKLLILLAALTASVIACDNPERDRCEARGGEWQAYNCHEVPITTYVLVGKVMVPITTWEDHCDHHCVGGDGSGWR